MKEAEIRKIIDELAEELRATPISKKTPATYNEGVYLSDSQAGKLTLEQSLDSLRLHIKYLLFDLAATRRENRYLMQMLENHPRPGQNPDSDGPAPK